MTAFLKFWVTSLHFIFFQFYQNAAIDFQNIVVKYYRSDTYEHPPKKSVAKKFVFNSKLLYLCTSNRKKASLVPKVGRYRRHIWVSIDARCRTSMTTQTRARNGASGELKYQPSKHTKVWLIIALPCVLRTVTSLKSIRLNHVSTRQWVQEPPCRCQVQSRSQPQRTGCSHQGHQSWQSQRESQHSNYSWRRF